jgi:signal transduction histidine kinase/CheY-like chemotaxis protein
MGDRALEVPPSSGGVEDDRLRAEQVAALFRVSAMGVLGAVVGAAVLAGVLVYAQVLSPVRGAVWAGYIAACAVAHLILRHLFQRRARVGRGWRPWAAGFTVISLAEGIGWGWASVRLVGYGRFDAEMLVIDACLALAVGSIAAFSFYLPAFAAMFFPTTVPFTVWSLMSPHPLQQAGGALMIVFVPVMAGLGLAANRNFTELVGLRIQSQMLADGLRRQKELAEEANLAKSTFLAAASHDLRQPVHALGLFVGALRNVAMPPEGVHIVDQIEASVAATNGLFGALLDISRLDAGIVEVRPRAFAIQPLLDRLCGEHAAEAAAKGIDLRCVRCGLVAFADPVLIERILRNLISNATRYTDSGRIVVGCRRGASLRVEVWDTGPGIPADQQEKIFQEYHQLANPERDRAKGLGLGLAIVRRLSVLVGCPVRLRSEPGRGSRFSLEIPRARDVAEAHGPIDVRAARPTTPKGLIMVIDDELAIREGMDLLLTGWGYEVRTAGSTAEALARLAHPAATPDLIVCDYRLREGETGLSAIRSLRARYGAPIPGVLLTGDTAPDRLREARDSGFLLLHKPVAHGRLRAALANLIAGAREADSEPTSQPAAVI